MGQQAQALSALQGNREKRLKGDEHMAVVEEFVYAVKEKWPHCLIQFEDFSTDRAFAILHRLRDKVLCFNDDIQVGINQPLPAPIELLLEELCFEAISKA